MAGGIPALLGFSLAEWASLAEWVGEKEDAAAAGMPPALPNGCLRCFGL
jgi:hypothetical protein